MKTIFTFILFLCLWTNMRVDAQNPSGLGVLHRFTLKNGLFPHPKRAEGHTYQNPIAALEGQRSRFY